MRRIAWLASVVVTAAGCWYYWMYKDSATPEIRTAVVSRGTIVTTVTATGTTEAVTSVSVGSQVSGTVASLSADFNSVVKRGQVIARLDTALLQAQVEQASANLTKVNADRQQRLAGLTDKQTKLARAEKLNEQALLSASDLGDAKLAVEMAKSDLESVTAQVAQAEASLNQARLNLNHAVIAAPIDGTVIQRNVDVGQTVAASLSSPTLFVIAADLADMRASLAVDESDISKIVPGQPVSMTVSAYPGERFRGEVAQVRLQPVVVSNVTTYTAIVDVANTDMKLKPGMTVTAQIEVVRRDEVLRVPNSALRFTPSAEVYAALGQPAPEAATQTVLARPAAAATSTSAGGTRVVLTSAAVVREATGPTPAARRGTAKLVWVFGEGELRAVPIHVGITDGTYTEVLASDASPSLAGGDAVVISVTTGADEVTKAAAPTASSSIFGGGSGRGGPR